MKSIHVFIAGPYDDSAPESTRQARAYAAMDVWHQLQTRGFVPYCPHLSHFLHEHKPKERNAWLHQQLQWLAKCDAVFRMPGESPGADVECDYARDVYGIPVFEVLDRLTQAYFGRPR